MRNLYVKILMALCGMYCFNATAQTDTNYYKYGIWQTFGEPMAATEYPELQGRLCNFTWSELEPAPDVWDWAAFDSDLTKRANDGLPIIFMVYTKEDAPEWIYDNGVPKVIEKDDKGNMIGHAPYYSDPEYQSLFRNMVTKVHQHIETLPTYVREQIIAVQGCYGSTGDYIGYKGTVSSQYALTGTQFMDLFQTFSKYYYDEYQTTSPKIYLLSNPNNNGEEQTAWLVSNCPGSWIKTGTLGKGYQFNYEKDKASWLYIYLNTPFGGNYMRSRSEIIGGGLSAPWWTAMPYKNMFAMLSYAVYWGVDWSNQGYDQIDDHGFDPAFTFYNKYAGQKDPATSNNAMCALKDVIDAQDDVRFPASQYGTVALTAARFNNVLAPFVSYGAKLEDINAALLGEQDNLTAKGTNDVGWNLIEGNYDKYLHQLNANETSAGYWNVTSADPNTIFGKFARGFDVAKGKNALYFDVENAFLNNKALNGSYPVMVEVTYLDKGTGSWQLLYDAQGNTNKSALIVNCANSNTWKTVSITLSDANFDNKSTSASDFYIKNNGSEKVLFSVVELSRSGGAVTGSSLSFSKPLAFDTICVNNISNAQQVSISGQLLNNTPVVIGPLNGFTFATAVDGTYSDSIVISNYGATFAQSIFAKFSPLQGRSYNGNIPAKGGGAANLNIPVIATAVNSNPVLSTVINNVSCYNAKNGSIDLQTSGGQGPFTYSWVSNANNFKSTSQDINALIPATYTVNINATYGCKSSASYAITQPDILVTSVSADPMLCRGGTTTLYVTAKGGTTPYNGAGTFTVSAGFKTYTVTDKNGCSDAQGFSAPNGSSTGPSKPGLIEGANADATGVCAGGNYTYTINAVSTATSYTWVAPAKSTIGSTTNGGRTVVLNTLTGFNGGSITVAANNTCGTSAYQAKSLKSTPAKPGGIVGPQTVRANQDNLVYTTAPQPGITYIWTVPVNAKIISGQNTNTIKVTWSPKNGKIKVKAKNDCDQSYNTAIDITVNNNSGSSTSISKNTPPEYALTAAPNPARDVTYLKFTAENEYRYTIQVTDMSGKIVLRKSGIADQGDNKILLNITTLNYGLYNVTVINNDNGEIITTKLVKG